MCVVKNNDVKFYFYWLNLLRYINFFFKDRFGILIWYKNRLVLIEVKNKSWKICRVNI